MRNSKKQKIPKYSNSKRFHELKKSGIYIRVLTSLAKMASELGQKNLVYFHSKMYVECPHEVFLAKF